MSEGIRETELDANFRILLEYIRSEADCCVFRVAFESSDDRYLLNYPEVTGLRFTSSCGNLAHEFTSRFLVSAPQDEFVLNPRDRIAFDLRAAFNLESTIERRWTINLAPGEYDVVYWYSIDPDRRRRDYLNKGSRFADTTKPWSGSVLSNVVRFRLTE